MTMRRAFIALAVGIRDVCVLGRGASHNGPERVRMAHSSRAIDEPLHVPECEAGSLIYCFDACNPVMLEHRCAVPKPDSLHNQFRRSASTNAS